MAGYAVTVYIERGAQGEIESKIVAYLATIDSGKSIRGFACTPYGSDNVLAVIVHDI